MNQLKCALSGNSCSVWVYGIVACQNTRYLGVGILKATEIWIPAKERGRGMCLVLLLLLGPAILTNQLRGERLILAHHSKL